MYDTSVLGINTGIPGAIMAISIIGVLQVVGGAVLLVVGLICLLLTARATRYEARVFVA